jgi:DNA uptake protein ComE-like DNA-binding protein
VVVGALREHAPDPDRRGSRQEEDMVRRSRLFPLLLSFLIGLALQASPALAAKAKAAKVNLNTASQQELEALPGVGEATAKKIIAARPYTSVEELGPKAGVPASTVQKLKGQVTTSSASSTPASEKTASTSSANANAKKSGASTKPEDKTEARPAATVASSTTHKHVDVNTATQQELEAVPWIGPATAKKIIAARPYKSLSELSRAGVPNATIQKAHSYLSVSHPTTKVAPVAASTAATGASASSPARPQASSSTAPATSAKAAPKTASTAPSQGTETEVAPRTAPAAGMVWVNTESKIYHYEGDRWYGKTKEGKFMTEEDAIKAGYRASKEGAPKAQ